MKTIHKLSFQPARGASFRQTHRGAKVLSAQEQGGLVSVWLQVDTDQPLVARTFYVSLTGGRCPDEGFDFVGTIQLHDGAFVLHVFDGGER